MSYAQWNPSTVYVVNDFVNYLGFNYKATITNVNVTPLPVTATWTLIPSGGGTGITNPLTANIDANNFFISNATAPPAGTASITLGGGQAWIIKNTDLTPLFVADTVGIELGSVGSGYQVLAPTQPAGNNTRNVATTAFVHRSQVNTLNFRKQLFPTLYKESIIYHNASTTITASTIQAQLDALPSLPQYITYGATVSPLIVAVGEGTNNTIAVSTDGIQFQGLGKPFSTRGNAVAWSGTRWLAVGLGTDNIMYSNNGLAWTGITGSSIFSAQGLAVFWTGQRYLLGGGGVSTMATSTDGLTVVVNASGSSTLDIQVTGFASNGEVIVAVGQGSIHQFAYSYDDGLTWKGAGQIGGTTTTNAISWNGERFIAGFTDGGSGTTSGFSFDGITWFSYGYQLPFDTNGQQSASNGTTTVIVGGVNNQIYASQDLSVSGGGNWNPVGFIFDYKGECVIWSGTMFITGGYGTVNTLGYSSDGFQWRGLGLSAFDSNCNGLACNIERANRINFPVNRIVGVGNGATGNIIYSNNSGVSWTNISGVLNTQALGIAYGNNQYVAVGAGTSPFTHCIANSFNGVYWRPNFSATTLFSSDGRGVVYGNRWVAVGVGSNTIASSTDADSWTGQGNGVFSSAGYGVAYNGTSTYVAVGSGTHTIAYSTTGGTSFTGVGSAIFTLNGRGVCWGTDKFVACGEGGSSLAYSTNGIAWNPVAGSTTLATNFNAVAHNGTIFMAVGNSSGTANIATSPDGVVWTGLGQLAIGTINGVAWAGNKWVITGQGTIGGLSNRVAYSLNSAGTSWVSLADSSVGFSSRGSGLAWNGSLGNAVIPATSVLLNDTNSRKLDVITAPYANGNYNNITITIKT